MVLKQNVSPMSIEKCMRVYFLGVLFVFKIEVDEGADLQMVLLDFALKVIGEALVGVWDLEWYAIDVNIWFIHFIYVAYLIRFYGNVLT